MRDEFYIQRLVQKRRRSRRNISVPPETLKTFSSVIQEDMFQFLLSHPNLPYDQFGISVVADALKKSLDRALLLVEEA